MRNEQKKYHCMNCHARFRTREQLKEHELVGCVEELNVEEDNE
jgi:DNA-directed RNA polymerase subunit RPC12/RpoP